VETSGSNIFTNIDTTANPSAATTTLSLSGVTVAQSGSQYRAVFNNGNGIATTTAAALTVTSSSNAATFLGSDTASQGAWSGVYGSDGYDVVGGGESLPAYASLSFSGANSWTWVANTTQTQALQTAPNSSSRVAATLYGQTFSATLNLTGGSHQVALYLVDWDGSSAGGGGARSEQIQIIDPSNNAVLSTQTVSNFSGGVYLVYNLTGNVIVQMTSLAGANALLNGIFFGSTAPAAPTISTNPQAQSTSIGATATFTAAATGSPSPSVQWQVEAPGGNTFTNIDTAANPSAATTTLSLSAVTLAQSGSQYRAVFTNGNGTATTTAATLTVTSSANSATFVGTDSSTQGTWSGTYGADGYDVIGGTESLPAYASLSFNGANSYTWAASTSQTQALQTSPNSSSRVAATLYGPTLTANVNVTGGAHQVAVYLMDWDGSNPGGGGARSEQVQIIDPSNNAVLSTQTVSNFSGGVYLIYNVTGNVIVKITSLTGANAVLNGVFFK
jgi:hypothetical protein